MRATDGTIRIAWLRDGEHRRLADQLLAASMCIALAIGLFLIFRRAVGALNIPLPVPQLLGTVTCVFAWAIAVRQLAPRRQFIIPLTVVVVLVFAIACSYPGTRLIDWLAWPTAIAGLVLSARMGDMVRIAGPPRGGCAVPGAPGSEQLLQQLTRLRTEEGQDALRGTLIGEFAPGERQATLYVAFCPPFERLPHVEVNLADDSDANVKLAQLLHNGAQLEVRLARPAAEPTRVELEFFATDADSV